MKKYLSYLLPLFLAISCGVRNPVLRDAARVIEDHPDSALYILDGVSRAELVSGREKAEYDRLRSRAFYQTYHFLDDEAEAALMRASLQAERQRNRTQTAALLAMAILSTLVLYFWARKIQTERLLAEKQAENERYMSAAEDLRSRLSSLQADRSKLGGLDTLDRLCEQYYIFEGTSNLQPRILGEVKSIVEGLRNDTRVQKNMEQALDQRTDGVMRRLRAAFPKWKEEDFLLYLFTASGFSATTISTLLEKDKPYVYNRLYRLKERIKALESSDREDFLACLEK
ncbi:MAG: hypothetical protein IJ156_01385 [Bacteroidales bacterium]|nr:hypothetical protein [Bacteroidales bacterium]